MNYINVDLVGSGVFALSKKYSLSRESMNDSMDTPLSDTPLCDVMSMLRTTWFEKLCSSQLSCAPINSAFIQSTPVARQGSCVKHSVSVVHIVDRLCSGGVEHKWVAPLTMQLTERKFLCLYCSGYQNPNAGKVAL